MLKRQHGGEGKQYSLRHGIVVVGRVAHMPTAAELGRYPGWHRSIARPAINRRARQTSPEAGLYEGQ